MKNKKTIKLDNREVTIEKLPIGRYAELLRSLQELPKKYQDFQSLNIQEIIAKLPVLIADSLPDVIRIVNVATPLEKEEIEQLGLDEIVEIVIAIFEVNNYAKVFESIKKAMPGKASRDQNQISTP